MKKTRLCALLLSMLMVLPGLASCSETQVPPETQAVVAETAGEAGEEAVEEIDFAKMSIVERMKYANAEIDDGLPEKMDFEGYKFKVQESVDGRILRTIEDTGETVSSAIYERQLAIEERFNISFESTDFAAGFTNFDTYNSAITKVLMAQDDSIDLLRIWNTQASVWTPQGYFLDLSQFDVLDFTKPWFYQDAINALSYKDHVYLSVDMAIPFFSGLQAVYFNKTLTEDHGITGLYDTVREGKWTLDYFSSIVKDLWIDVDGNGEIDKNGDVFGAAHNSAEISFMGIPSFGATIIAKDAEDVPFYNVGSNLDLFNTIYSTMRSLVFESNGVVRDDWEITPFVENRALFGVKALSALNQLRDAEFEYGVLPFYKWDESQQNYGSAYLPYPNAIPVSAANPELSAIVLCALASSGFKHVVPVYYENALTTKLIRDEESAEMMDIIASNITVDGTILYLDDGIYYFHNFCGNNTEFATFAQRNMKKMEKEISSQIKKMEELLVNGEG